MARSPLFDALSRTLRLAQDAERHGVSTSEGFERRAAGEAQLAAVRRSRRDVLKGAGVAAAGLALGFGRKAHAAKKAGSLDVGIVGAGLAGLVAGHTLQQSGVYATLYEAGDRVGGRCWSLPGVFPGQVAERGGELIDNLHKTMLGYVNAFDLPKEDLTKDPGEILYHFDGHHYPEAQVVEEYRAFVPAMSADLRALTGATTADNHNDADLALDHMSLREYLVSRGASPLLRKALEEAYVAEYGLEPEYQSSLNFLYFAHADRRSTFLPFGVFSDERFHVVGGNDRIAAGIADILDGQVHLGMKLVAARKTAAGRVELTFKDGSRTVRATHDVVIFALPFSTLRDVALDASLGLPDWKLSAIRELGYGNNAKLMIGFTGRPWAAQGSNGTAYSDLPNVQTVWETNPSNATSSRAVLTDYSGGVRGASLSPSRAGRHAEDFVRDFDRIVPGAAAAARREGGAIVAHLEHWPSNPLTKGSYTCYLPGQFTGLCGNEGKPVGNLFFAGEHADSFYSWQGFMEGACLSGIRAASDVMGRP